MDETPGTEQPDAEHAAVATSGGTGDGSILPPGAGEPSSAGPTPSEEEKRSFFKELPILILIAFALALLIKTFLAQAFFIPSESMVPTLEIGDRVLVNKLVYRFREPQRGEIIVFIAEKGDEPRSFLSRVRGFLTEGLGVVTPTEKDFIKRVIALPGETIQINDRGRVFITPADGGERFRLDEPYLAAEKDLTPFGPFTVPPDTLFVMGDNRANSSDSRTLLGPVSRSDVIGKAFLRIWPPRRMGFFHRPVYDTGGDAARAALPLGVLALAGGYPFVRGARRSPGTPAPRRRLRARRGRR